MHPDEAHEPVAGFDWDDAKRAKCQQHGVSVPEIEGLFRQPLAIFPDPAHSRDETRFKAIGRTEAARHVLIVFTLRQREGDRLIRPISARYMHEKEVKYYEEAAKTAQR